VKFRRIFSDMALPFEFMPTEQRLTQRQNRKLARQGWFRETSTSLRRYELAEVTAELWEMCEDSLLQVKAQEGEAELLASLRMSCVICRRKYRSLELATAVLTDAVTAMLEDLDLLCCLEGEFKDCENAEFKRCKLYIRGVSLKGQCHEIFDFWFFS